MSAGLASFSPAIASPGDEAALVALRQRVQMAALDRPGIYRMRSPDGEVLYVGKSKRVRTRLMSYFRCSFPEDKGARLLREAQAIEWDYVPSEFAALLAEMRQIKRYRPRYNVAMKRDARHYAFIKLLRGVAPRLLVVRGGTYEEGATYFGPFVGANGIAEAVRELNDLLGLRDCSLDRRMRFSDQQELFEAAEQTPGCVRYEIGKCQGPCIGATTSVAYMDSVRRARAFLDGADEEPMDRLRNEMLGCSSRMEYERAGMLRDKLERLERLHSQFARLRFAAETLSFVYVVPGVSGDDRVYLIRRGQVRAERDLPRSPSDARNLADLSEQVYSGAARMGSAIPTHEIDELLLLSIWFKQNPRELTRTCAPADLPVRGMGKTLRRLLAA
jgi:excinuclease ABC subunit C